MDINEATAKALQAARAVSGMTYDELAEKSGVSVQTIYRMFGAKRDIKLPQLYALAQAMGMTVVELMQDAERIQSRDLRRLASAPATENTAAAGAGERLSDSFIDDIAAHPEQYGIAANRDENKTLEAETSLE